MEEKKISEQESLELINQMIEQTRRDSTVGSGNTFLIWGYVCMVVSLAVFVAAYTGPGAWGWLYLGIPVMGGTATLIAGRKKRMRLLRTPRRVSTVFGRAWQVCLPPMLLTVSCIGPRWKAGRECFCWDCCCPV